MGFKVGDKVKVKDNLVKNRNYGALTLFDGMHALRGKSGVIREITTAGNYRLDNISYTWSYEMLEKIEEDGKMTIEMLEKQFPVGTKVVPHSKTPIGYEGKLEYEGNWKRALEKKQPYLYVNRIDESGRGQNVLVLGVDREYSGNYFLPEDVTIYIEGLVISEDVQKILDAIKVLRDITNPTVAGKKNGLGTVAQWEYMKPQNSFAIVVNVAEGGYTSFVDVQLKNNKLTLGETSWNHGMAGGDVISQNVFEWLESLKKPSKKTVLEGQIKEMEDKLAQMKSEVKNM